MRTVAVEFEARFWFPGMDRRGEWGWRRSSETVHINLPDPGMDYVTHLPPPLFTYSAADLVRLRFRPGRGGIRFDLEWNGRRMFSAPWRETALWSQIRFDPWIDAPDNRMWTLRWRCPDAPNDLWAKTYAYLETLDDPGARQLRREITLFMLGATAPTP